MNLRVKVAYLRGIKHAAIERICEYRSDEQFADIEAGTLSDEIIQTLYERAQKANGADGARALLQKISTYRNVRSNPTGKPIKTLQALETALEAYIAPSPNKWLFNDGEDGFPVPYFVEDVSYHPPKRDSAAYVKVSLVSCERGERKTKSCTFSMNDLGKTVTEILNEDGYYLETEAAVAKYWEDIALYREWADRTGMQFNAVGVGYPDSNWNYSTISMEREGQPTKVVMDDTTNEDSTSSDRRRRSSSGDATTASSMFWSKTKRSGKDEDDDDDIDDKFTVVVPVHPYVKVFDLAKHEFVIIHVRNITPYVYDKTAEKKLVLDPQTKTLVTILVEGSSEVMEDIIQGKTGGTIVISTGPPGTGKTLTAEVFSEEIERPLYVVQCSQLGTNEETVEKQLSKVLTRASRWKAILLIDEADVYVHERGTDIQQNAIVGVFLRVLEHYRGVLFLTSNRQTIIDDAIMSRATAWIKYEYPSPQQLADIWTVLSKQYKVEINDKLIHELVEAFPHISGRNVKNMLKLARMLLRKAKTTGYDLKLFKYVATFLDLRTDQEKPAS